VTVVNLRLPAQPLDQWRCPRVAAFLVVYLFSRQKAEAKGEGGGAGRETGTGVPSQPMTDRIDIRGATIDDASSLADAWTQFGRYYSELDPRQFRTPDADGLSAWFAARLDEDRDDDFLWLVAERDRALVGFVEAQIWRPAEDARRQLMREADEPILKVDSIMVVEEARSLGVGTALMRAAEAWGRGRGATRSVVVSYAHSPSSVPFYEDRMGYERNTVGISKKLRDLDD
jgi:GNAT superfamily N-acetyltransferase